jgi:hypothetical protein
VGVVKRYREKEIPHFMKEKQALNGKNPLFSET